MSPYKRRTPPEAQAALDKLTLAKAAYLRRTIEIARDLLLAIRDCLDCGATWGEVGDRLGMSKQGARAHWGPHLDRLIAAENRQPGTVEVPPVPPVPAVPSVPPVPPAPPVPDVPPGPDVPCAPDNAEPA
ncbi:MAG TPA: hypothetical protein VMC03_21010 [Streptosporangiaceae bacterium]|nr:hypothetical protein [Streptosporangiaceae bacterium]